jgi:hypothetical protein
MSGRGELETDARARTAGHPRARSISADVARQKFQCFLFVHRQVGPRELEDLAVKDASRGSPGRSATSEEKYAQGRLEEECLDERLSLWPDGMVVILDYDPGIWWPVGQVSRKHPRKQ